MISPPTKQSVYRPSQNQPQNDENSFQSLSSVGILNDKSGATDMQIEDFFDPQQNKGKRNYKFIK